MSPWLRGKAHQVPSNHLYKDRHTIEPPEIERFTLIGRSIPILTKIWSFTSSLISKGPPPSSIVISSALRGVAGWPSCSLFGSIEVCDAIDRAVNSLAFSFHRPEKGAGAADVVCHLVKPAALIAGNTCGPSGNSLGVGARP